MTYQELGRLKRFWSWWWPSLLSWLPAGARNRLDRSPTYQFLNWNGKDLEGMQQPKEHTDGTIVVLPAHMALVRRLRLPINAVPSLQDIAAFEVERQTPFTTASAYHAAAPRGSARTTSRSFEAVLAVVPKHMLEAAVDAARASTARLIGVDVMGDGGRPLGVNLLPVRERFRSPVKWQRWNSVLFAISLLAIFGILFSMLQARERAVADLQKRFQPLQAQAAETQRRGRLLVQLKALAAARVGGNPPLALDLLSELSRQLPVDSHLLQIRLDDDVISVRGRTRNLGGVLQKLGESVLWDDPKLSGSRTLPDGQEQEFSLSLRLKDSGAAAPR